MIKESQPSVSNAPVPALRKNRPFLRVGAAIASLGLALPACGTGGSSENSTNTVPGKASTTVPSTTVELPSTTLEPLPSDVAERRVGYDVLKNGGFRYEVPSAPEFGGFEIHIHDNLQSYGFKEVDLGTEAPQEVLFRNMLLTFGAQHSEFLNSEGKVDVDAYKAYLEENDWIDTVYLPVNTSNLVEAVKFPPIIKSDPLVLDFKKPFLFSNGKVQEEGGFDLSAAFRQSYFPTPADNAVTTLGITADGQFFHSFRIIDDGGILQRPDLSVDIVNWGWEIGYVFSVVANLTYDVEDRLQWYGPDLAFWVPAGQVDPTNIPDYDRLKNLVLNPLDFSTPDFRRSTMFAPVS